MKLIGFFAFIYGWFSLDTYGFTIEGFLALIIGALLISGTEILAHFQWRRYHNDK